MRKRRPHVATLDEVSISRCGENALIEFADESVMSTQVRIGPSIRGLTDQQILDQFNEMIAGEEQAAAQYVHVAVEIPPGQPQIQYFAPGQQWAPRGDVLRCVVDDSGPDGEAVVHIDEHDLSLSDFGRLICTYAGWGMRIVFVPEDDLEESPEIEVREPEE